jgi:hypothetical protein
MALPPVSVGVSNATLAEVSPGVTPVIAGAPGTVRGVTEVAVEAVPVPASLVAVTVQSTGVPFVRPATVIGEALPVWVWALQVAV